MTQLLAFRAPRDNPEHTEGAADLVGQTGAQMYAAKGTGRRTLAWGKCFAASVLSCLLVLSGCATVPRPSSPNSLEPEEPVSTVVLPSPAKAPQEPSKAVEDSPAPAPSPPPRIANGSELFERLRAQLSPPACVRGTQNEAWRRRYTAHPRAFEAQLRNALPIMAFVLENVEERKLPGEFVLIPLIESGYRANARGLRGPLGLWQMIPSTARNHGLRVERGHDDRLSVEASTEAALSYLSTLHSEFGEWRATAMAYNAGEGRLRRAFARAGKAQVSGERRLPAGMSGITYAYVAKLHALACLIAAPQRHGLSLPTDAFTPFGAAAATDSRPNAALAAAAAESATSASERTHRVQAGETLWRISRRYGVSLDALLRANGLRKDGVLRIGQDLRIPH